MLRINTEAEFVQYLLSSVVPVELKRLDDHPSRTVWITADDWLSSNMKWLKKYIEIVEPSNDGDRFFDDRTNRIHFKICGWHWYTTSTDDYYRELYEYNKEFIDNSRREG